MTWWAIAGLAATVVGFLVWLYFEAKASGKRQARVDALDDTFKRAKEAERIRDDVEKLSDAELDDALARRVRGARRT